MKHYIIIEVRESENRKYGTDAGDIRKIIHEFCKEENINAADAMIREDREWLHPLVTQGFAQERNPYHMAKEVFQKAMGPRWRKLKKDAPEELPRDGKWQV